jgi:hypothetical protein
MCNCVVIWYRGSSWVMSTPLNTNLGAILYGSGHISIEYKSRRYIQTSSTFFSILYHIASLCNWSTSSWPMVPVVLKRKPYQTLFRPINRTSLTLQYLTALLAHLLYFLLPLLPRHNSIEQWLVPLPPRFFSCSCFPQSWAWLVPILQFRLVCVPAQVRLACAYTSTNSLLDQTNPKPQRRIPKFHNIWLWFCYYNHPWLDHDHNNQSQRYTHRTCARHAHPSWHHKI